MIEVWKGNKLKLSPFDSPLAFFPIFFDPAFSKSAIHSIFSSASNIGTGMGIPPAMMNQFFLFFQELRPSYVKRKEKLTLKNKTLKEKVVLQ
jgi:hypothetical protein